MLNFLIVLWEETFSELELGGLTFFASSATTTELQSASSRKPFLLLFNNLYRIPDHIVNREY
jgi:hypothetical protein